jgi:glycosyltransferase involved in cell wall biosynthesis
MSEIKVSVIVPCYNYGRFLKECLDSVLLQTFRDWECIIVDNGSTDNTQEVAKSFTDQDERFRYVHTEQKGVSFARNLAVNMSSGKYILPLDADDKIGNTYVEKAYNLISANKNLKVVYCDAELFGASKGKWRLPAYSLKDLLIENSIFCSGMYSKLDFDRIGGYSEDMKEGFEDWDFWIKLLKEGGEVFKIPECLFYYRIRENSRNSVLDNEKQLRLRKQIYLHHKDIYDKMFPLHELIFDYHSEHKELAGLRASRDHKVGAMILSPLRFIKRLFGG